MRNPLVLSLVSSVLLFSAAACDKPDAPQKPADPRPAESASTGAASSAATAASASAAVSASAAPSASAPNVASASAVVSAQPATSASAAASAKTATSASADAGPTCGTKPLPDCPLQAWMKANANPPMMTSDLPKLAEAFDKIAKLGPTGYTNWASIAKDGASAARANDLAAAKRACGSCHDQYKAKYRTELRTRPVN
jgi:hypothetical protein